MTLAQDKYIVEKGDTWTYVACSRSRPAAPASLHNRSKTKSPAPSLLPTTLHATLTSLAGLTPPQANPTQPSPQPKPQANSPE